MSEAQAIVEALIGLVKYVIPLIVVLGAAYFVSKVGLEAVKSFFTGNGIWGPLAAVVIVAIIALGAGLLFKPTSTTTMITTMAEFSFGTDREKRALDVNLYADIVSDPEDNPYTWENPVARTAATAVEEGFFTKIRVEQEKQTTLEAKIACRLAPGHPKRKLWDEAKINPCSATAPTALLALGDSIEKVDWDKVNVSMKTPLGDPSVSSSGLVKDISALPSGVGIWAGSLLSLLVLGLFAKFTFR